MTEPVLSKREINAARTREKLVDAAVDLYGSRSIDAVSLREIAVAAGQKNSNALQYHFSNRDGLLQAIIDKHATAIATLRESCIPRIQAQGGDARVAALALVTPIIDYINRSPEGLNFVRVVSQIASVYQNGAGASPQVNIRFPRTKALETLFNRALAKLPPQEAQRRIYLVVNITFHTIADIYSANENEASAGPTSAVKPMVQQLVCLIESYFNAPATRGLAKG